MRRRSNRLHRLAAIAIAGWLLAPATSATPAVPGPCAGPPLVDPHFRDAALTALDRLWVRAPGLAAHGAVRTHDSIGHVDPTGSGWQQVSAYAANLGLTGALRVAPSLAPAAADWLRWQARHVAEGGVNRGVVADHWLRSTDLTESTCPPGIALRLCDHVDASDSTAASTLIFARALAETSMTDGRTPNTAHAVFMETPVRRLLEAAASTLGQLTQADSLTWARPVHRVAYLMDNVEVVAGWRAWSLLQRTVYRQPRAAALSAARADRAENAIVVRLWDGGSGHWRVSSDAAGFSPARWYPDTVAQAWPLLWQCAPGLATVGQAAAAPCDADAAPGATAAWQRSLTAWRNAVQPWQGPDGWADRNVDPDGFWWPAVAVAARCLGDEAPARRWVARARARWLDPAAPFAWPFQISDLLWLFAMASSGDPAPPPAVSAGVTLAAQQSSPAIPSPTTTDEDHHATSDL